MLSAVIFKYAFPFKVYHDSRTITKNNSSIVAEKSSRLSLHIDQSLHTVQPNVSPVTVRGTFDVEIFLISCDTIYSAITVSTCLCEEWSLHS